jgi:ribonucleotide monophosphatase NagD (HAD superfamily)
MGQGIIKAGKPERWITQITNGIVTLVHRIDADAFVVRAHDLPSVAANIEIVGDDLASEIMSAIRSRDL